MEDIRYLKQLTVKLPEEDVKRLLDRYSSEAETGDVLAQLRDQKTTTTTTTGVPKAFDRRH